MDPSRCEMSKTKPIVIIDTKPPPVITCAKPLPISRK